MGNANPATRLECWTGGRILHWLPYQTNDSTVNPGKEDFFNIVTMEILKIDAWRSTQPNAKKGVQCVKTYLGNFYGENL